MNFAFNEKTKELQRNLQTFMEEHVYPNEQRFHDEVERDRWKPTGIIEGLKPRAHAHCTRVLQAVKPIMALTCKALSLGRANGGAPLLLRNTLGAIARSRSWGRRSRRSPDSPRQSCCSRPLPALSRRRVTWPYGRPGPRPGCR